MKSYVYRVELEEEDGVWSAVVPALPGCAVDAGTREDALEAIREAAEACIEILSEQGRPIPLDEVKSGSEGAAVR